MKILFILSTLFRGGAEKTVCSLASKVKENGDEAALLSMHGGGSLLNEIRLSDVPVFVHRSLPDLVKDVLPKVVHDLANYVNVRRRRHHYTREFRLPERQLSSASVERWVKNKIESLRPDIVHVHQANCVEALRWAKECGLRAILYTHHNMTGEVSSQSEIRLLNDCVPSADWVTFVSSAQREDFLSNIVYPGNRTSVIYPQTAFAGKARKDRPPTPALILGTMNNLSPVKDPMILLDALAGVRRAGGDVRLFIAGGDPRWRAVVEEELRNRELHDAVRFFGALETNLQIQTFYDQIDVYVSTSISESFGLALKEAMDCGVPVLTSDNKPVRELVDDGKTGLVFHRGNVEDLVTKIKFCLSNPTKLKEIGLEGRAYSQSRFVPSRSWSEYRALYEQLLK